jgi:anti-sigma factor RsiW
MSHRPELLSGMLDGELTETEVAWVVDHLDGCGRCRMELDDLASARAAVRSLPMLDLPDGIVPEADVMRLWPRRLATATMSAAAAVVVAIGALGMIGMASDATTAVDVSEAEAILAATSSLGVVSDGSAAAELLTSGSSARYSARQTMACRDENGSVGATVDVTRVGSVTVMADPLAQLTVLNGGSVSTGRAEGPIETVTVTGPAPTVGDYSVSATRREDFRGRVTDVVTLGLDGHDRANLLIDGETGVIVYRELLDADGSATCVLELVEFEPLETPIQASIPFDIRAEVTESVYEPVTGEMPAQLAGIPLVATYPIDDGLVGVYGDGLFTIAVMRVGGGRPDPATSDQSVSTVWESDGVSWAVVGSLPDDLMRQLMASLPQPEDANPFVEGWRILFD